MRKLLLWLATMIVGGATFMTAMAMFSGSVGVFFAGLVFWVLALSFGVALSAPAFMDPPEDGGGIWFFRLPIALWLFLMVMKLMSWIGFYVLLGTWIGILHFWNSRNTGRRPSFSGGSQQQPVQQQPVQHQYATQQHIPQQHRPAIPPASWQHDPTGRYMSRYWDGIRWTDQVANGRMQAVDPL